MSAKHVILTHFSQRYPKFPLIPDEECLGVVVAFDLMKVGTLRIVHMGSEEAISNKSVELILCPCIDIYIGPFK